MKNIYFISLGIYILVRPENIDTNNTIYTEEYKIGNTNVYTYADVHGTIINKKEAIDLKENRNMYIEQF